MKKNVFEMIVAMVNGQPVADMDTLRNEVNAEWNKMTEKKQANRDLYAEAKNAILGGLSDTPVTIAELFEEVKDDLPQGFTKSKVQYAITRLWADEVTKTEGKVNTYTRKV
jgi:hypothetical protein